MALLDRVIVSLNFSPRKLDEHLKLRVARKASARQPVEHLVYWVKHNAGRSPNHLRERLPTELTLTEAAPRPKLVGCNLPLKLHVPVWALAKLSANHPGPRKATNREPIDAACNKPKAKCGDRAAAANEAAANQYHQRKDKVEREPPHRAVTVTKIIILGSKQLIGCPPKACDDWLLHACRVVNGKVERQPPPA
jgi:hypothetical protein